jgi:hypothetical protein
METTVKLNDRYFNLIEMECFTIVEGPTEYVSRVQFRKNNTRNVYKVLWEDGTKTAWLEEELIKWLNNKKLNIKVKDDKHLLMLQLKYDE